MKVKNR